jgi:hypothetical protein
MMIRKETIRELFNNGRRLYIILYLCGVVLMNILALPYFGIGTGYSAPVFSITSTNEPLYEILAKISKTTGYQIEITKGWENKSLTANLDNFTLEEGIKEIIRLIGRPNYAMTMNDSMKKVEIKIFDASTGYPSVASNSLAEFQQRKTKEVLNPGTPSTGQNKGTGVATGTKTDILDKELLPPGVEMGKAIAERKPEEHPEFVILPPD